MRFPITKQTFIDWLEFQSPRKRVGDPNKTDACPLCRAIEDTEGLTVELENTVNWKPLGADDTWAGEVPDWAHKFQVHAIAESNGRQITASKALKLMGEL